MEPAATPRLTWAFRIARLLLHILSGLLQSALYPHLRQSTQRRMTQRWSAALLRILNVRLRCNGTPPDDAERRVMLAANHVSWLDVYALNAACPARFVAKAEIRGWPLFGWLSRNVGTLFIERTKRSDTARINADIARALIQGDRVTVFPEGTTSDGSLLRHFHASLLQPAVAVAAILHPVAIRYTDTAGTPGRAAAFSEISLLESLRRVLRQPWIEVELIFIAPLPSHDRNRRELARQVEHAIAGALSLPLPHTAPERSPDPPDAPQ